VKPTNTYQEFKNLTLVLQSGLWAPFPVWLAGALAFVIQMSAAPPSGLKSAAVGLLIAAAVMLVVFIIAMIAAFSYSGGSAVCHCS
jgi:hypothetical protein